VTFSEMEAALKRALDVSLASLGIAASWPLLLGVAGGRSLPDGGAGDVSPGFGSLSGSLREKGPFRLWKFRTMTNERSADGALLPER